MKAGSGVLEHYFSLCHRSPSQNSGIRLPVPLNLLLLSLHHTVWGSKLPCVMPPLLIHWLKMWKALWSTQTTCLYCRGSGKASFQQTGWLRPQLKTGLFPLLTFFAPFFTVLSENTSLPVLTLLTSHFPHGLTADSSEHHPTIQTVRQGHSLLQQHRCPAIPPRLLRSFDRAALQ